MFFHLRTLAGNPLNPAFFNSILLNLPVFLFLAISQAYLIPKVLDQTDGFDFRLIWLAGELWSNGISPYSEAFGVAYRATFGTGPSSHFWVYPPYAWLVSRPLAMLPFETAVLVWNILNYCLLIATAWIFAQLSLTRIAAVSTTTRFVIGVSALSIIQATPFALALGQTSFLMLFGLAALLKATQIKSHGWLALGTALIMLKPNFGLFIVLFLATWHWTWRPIGAVAAIYLVVSCGVAAQTGLLETLMAFLSRLSDYNAPHIAAGQPANLTGLVHLADWVGMAIPSSILYALAALLAILSGVLTARPFEGLRFAAVGITFLIPLHTYDMMLAVLCVAALCLHGKTARTVLTAALGLVAAACLLRPDNLGVWLGLAHPDSMRHFAGSLLVSIALLIGCGLAALEIARSPRRAPAPGR